jgi:hypothetical protein
VGLTLVMVAAVSLWAPPAMEMSPAATITGGSWLAAEAVRRPIAAIATRRAEATADRLTIRCSSAQAELRSSSA